MYVINDGRDLEVAANLDTGNVVINFGKILEKDGGASGAGGSGILMVEITPAMAWELAEGLRRFI